MLVVSGDEKVTQDRFLSIGLVAWIAILAVLAKLSFKDRNSS